MSRAHMGGPGSNAHSPKGLASQEDHRDQRPLRGEGPIRDRRRRTPASRKWGNPQGYKDGTPRQDSPETVAAFGRDRAWVDSSGTLKLFGRARHARQARRRARVPADQLRRRRRGPHRASRSPGAASIAGRSARTREGRPPRVAREGPSPGCADAAIRRRPFYDWLDVSA
jgi:hypothetical protein